MKLAYPKNLYKGLAIWRWRWERCSYMSNGSRGHQAGFASRVLERCGPTTLGFLNVLPAQLLDKISIHLLRKSYNIHRESILHSNLPSLFLAIPLPASKVNIHVFMNSTKCGHFMPLTPINLRS